jgi:hypothetical protein
MIRTGISEEQGMMAPNSTLEVNNKHTKLQFTLRIIAAYLHDVLFLQSTNQDWIPDIISTNLFHACALVNPMPSQYHNQHDT